MAPSRRARLHARVAGVLKSRRGRETEEARHWLAAGPTYAAQAWQAAVAAAEVARQLYAHEETADLLRAAYAAMADDPEVTPRQRYDVLLHPPTTGTFFVRIRFQHWVTQQILATRTVVLNAR